LSKTYDYIEVKATGVENPYSGQYNPIEEDEETIE